MELSSKVEVYVPSTNYVRNVVDTHEIVRRTAEQMTCFFGGATVCQGEGYYCSEAGDIVVEVIYIVWAFCTTEQLETYVDDVIRLAVGICRELNQESVAITVNGQMRFVSATKG